jgi:hypothetical protein
MLKVFVDGVPMPESEALAFWRRFSEHMEANRGDLAGFAKKEGFASVHPMTGPEGAELHASKRDPQRPYTTAARRSGSGSAKNQALPRVREKPR